MRQIHTAMTTLTTAASTTKNQRCQPPALARKLKAAPVSSLGFWKERLEAHGFVVRQDERSPIEQQYLDILNLSYKDLQLAHDQLQSFVTFHETNEYLQPTDAECIANARHHLIKFRMEVRDRIASETQSLRAALARAKNLESTNRARALGVYQSIIQLYSKSSWAEEYVDQAKRGLQQLEGTKSPTLSPNGSSSDKDDGKPNDEQRADEDADPPSDDN